MLLAGLGVAGRSEAQTPVAVSQWNTFAEDRSFHWYYTVQPGETPPASLDRDRRSSVIFRLYPPGTPGTVPLYRSAGFRGSAVLHADARPGAQVIGGMLSRAIPQARMLYAYDTYGGPLYSINPPTDDMGDQKLVGPLGYVFEWDATLPPVPGDLSGTGAGGGFSAFPSLAQPELCVTYTWSVSPARGRGVQLAECGKYAVQKLRLEADGHLAFDGFDGDKPLCLSTHRYDDGSEPVFLEACRPLSGAQDAQRWSRKPTGEILDRQGRCLGARAGATELGLLPCTRDPRQRFTGPGYDPKAVQAEADSIRRAEEARTRQEEERRRQEEERKRQEEERQRQEAERNRPYRRALYVVDGTGARAEHLNLMWHFFRRWEEMTRVEPVRQHDGANDRVYYTTGLADEVAYYWEGVKDVPGASDGESLFTSVANQVCRDVKPRAAGGLGVQEVHLAGFSRGAMVAVRVAHHAIKQCGARVVYLGLVDAVNTSIKDWRWPTTVAGLDIPVAVHVHKPNQVGATVLGTMYITGIQSLPHPQEGVPMLGIGAISHERMVCPMDELGENGARWNESRLVDYAQQRLGIRFAPRLHASCDAAWYDIGNLLSPAPPAPIETGPAGRQGTRWQVPTQGGQGAQGAAPPAPTPVQSEPVRPAPPPQPAPAPAPDPWSQAAQPRPAPVATGSGTVEAVRGTDLTQTQPARSNPPPAPTPSVDPWQQPGPSSNGGGTIEAVQATDLSRPSAPKPSPQAPAPTAPSPWQPAQPAQGSAAGGVEVFRGSDLSQAQPAATAPTAPAPATPPASNPWQQSGPSAPRPAGAGGANGGGGELQSFQAQSLDAPPQSTAVNPVGRWKGGESGSDVLDLLAGGTYRFAGAEGRYQVAGDTVVFSGDLARWNGGRARLQNGVLIFSWQDAQGQYSITFRR